jgi:predicted ABC-type ATPase
VRGSARLARLAEPQTVSGIVVLAGVNGAGKSSILGQTFLQRGVEVFNPDTATDLILQRNPALSREQANQYGWEQGRRLLERAIEARQDYAFETTLGGATITALLQRALRLRQHVYMSYVGLDGPGLHIARVRHRVAAGGHDVPEERIRVRYEASRLNLIRLLPRLTELRVYDNSRHADPAKGAEPRPALILHTARGRVQAVMDLPDVPQWAKPIVAAALTAQGSQPRRS